MVIKRMNMRMASEGLRVLGFAYKSMDRAPPGPPHDQLSDLTWLGLAGMTDPVRPGVQDLMTALHRAGLHTVMLTGDQIATARAIGEKLSLNGEASSCEHDGGARLGKSLCRR